MKLWRHLSPRQQLKRVKQLRPMMISSHFLLFGNLTGYQRY